MSNTTKPQWTLLSMCIEKIADTIEGYQALPVPAELKEKLLNKLLTKEEILDKDVNLALFLDADIKKIDLTYYIQRQSLASFTELFASFHSTLTHLAVNNYSNLSNEHAKVIATCKSLEFLDLRSTNLDDDMLAIIISSCTQIKYLDISKCPQLRRITHPLNYLETLKLSTIRPTSYSLAFANTNATTLKSLHIYSIEDKSIVNKILDNCHQLSSLRIERVQIEWPQSFKNLTALEDISVQFMDDRVFDSMMEHCTKLKNIEVQKSVRLSTANFAKLGERCQSTERLYFNNSLFVDEMFAPLASNATRLRSLSLRNCSTVSQEELAGVVRRRTTLEELLLMDTPIDDHILLQLAEANKTNLKSLALKTANHVTSDAILHVCTTITSLTSSKLSFESFASKTLKSLTIKTEQGLRYTKTIECPSLTRLDLAGARLNDECLQSLLSQSVNLTSVSIAITSSRALSLLSQYQTALEVLYVNYSRASLNKCAEFEQLIALNRLKSVTGIIDVKSIDIQSNSLRSLDLTCSEHLSVEAPNLRSLIVSGSLAKFSLEALRLTYLNVYSQTPFSVPSGTCAPNLEKMVVGLWNEAPVAKIAQYVLDEFPRLNEMRIIGGQASKISIRSTKLTALSIVRNIHLVLIDAKECPSLARLELSRCYEMNVERILESLSRCPSVKRVVLEDGQDDSDSADLLILQSKRMDVIFN